MKQIKIKVQSCVFRGQTVFRGDVVPPKNKPALTVDELGVMVPRLADELSDHSEREVSEDKPAEEPKEEKPVAKKSDKKKG